MLAVYWFVLYLVFILVTQGNDGNCGCFGIKHSFTPLEGIVKNALTLALLFVYAKFNDFQLMFKGEKMLFIALIVASIAFPQIKEPIDFSVEDKFDKSIGKDIGLDSLSTVVYQEQKINLSKGKHLIAFFSMGCKYCKLTSQKMNLIAHRVDVDFKRFYFFGKEDKNALNYEEDLLKFWKVTKSDVVPNKMLLREAFYKSAGYSLPAVYLIENGEIVKQLSFRSIDEDKITSFFKE